MHPDCNAAYQRCNPMPLRIQVEHVVSAAGIARIYYYLRAGAAATADSGAATADSGAAAAAAVDAEVRAAIDPSAVVAAHGTPGEMGADPYCMAAMEAFLDALGAEAANLALRFQAQGGVFLAGVQPQPASRRHPTPASRACTLALSLTSPSPSPSCLAWTSQAASPRSSRDALRPPTARLPRGSARRTWARRAPSRPTARARCTWSPSRATVLHSRAFGALRAAARAAPRGLTRDCMFHGRVVTMLYTTQAAPRGRTLYKRCDARAPHNRLRRLSFPSRGLAAPAAQCLSRRSPTIPAPRGPPSPRPASPLAPPVPNKNESRKHVGTQISTIMGPAAERSHGVSHTRISHASCVLVYISRPLHHPPRFSRAVSLRAA